MKKSIRVNEATIVFNMTAHIFNVCIPGGMYGEFKTNEITAKLYQNSEEREYRRHLGRVKRGQEIWEAAEHLRKETRMAEKGERGSECFPPLPTTWHSQILTIATRLSISLAVTPRDQRSKAVDERRDIYKYAD